MHPIFRLALPLAGWLALAGAGVDIPGYPKDRRSSIPLDVLKPYTTKAPKVIIENQIVGREVVYKWDYPAAVADATEIEYFTHDGKYSYRIDGLVGRPLFYGSYYINNGKICIQAYDNKNYPFHKCRLILLDREGAIWMQLPGIEGPPAAVVPTLRN